MAEGFTQGVTCRYFLNGVCREGSSCHFSHDRQGSRPSMICRYYLRGVCTYGANCRYDHVRQERLDANRKAANANARKASEVSQRARTPPSSNGMQVLKKSSSSTAGSKSINSVPPKSSLCVDAPVFVPRCAEDASANAVSPSQVSSEISYAQVVGDSNCGTTSSEKGKKPDDPSSELCPFYLVSGHCPQIEQCTYIHGLLCEMCQLACLHPDDEKQRESHIKECTKLMEAEMEHSFAVARSREKVCGICMDTVMERNLPSQRRFGILPNCSHCFCLDCLRKWRQSKQFENKIVRACPECRVKSDYVIPSRYWVDDKERDEKDKLLLSYRNALGDKHCKYFKKGEGQCPFGNKCFYLHALPDGTKKDVGPPRQRRRYNADGELQLYLDDMMLWDFIEEREQRLELLRGSIQTLLLELEFDDLAEDLLFADDSMSDISDI